MSEQENTGLVQQTYQNFKSGDIQGVLGALSDDIEWVLPEIQGVPFARTYHGVEDVGQFFSALGDSQDVLEFEPREFVAQGEKVAALGHYAWRVKSTGQEFESDFAHVFSARDGKLTRFQEYADTAAIAAAYRGG